MPSATTAGTIKLDSSDPFGEFLAAPSAPAPAVAPAADSSGIAVSAASTSEAVKQEEQNFFNQKAGDSSEKLTKDSILALYSKGSQPPQMPSLVNMTSQMNPQLNPQMQQQVAPQMNPQLNMQMQQQMLSQMQAMNHPGMVGPQGVMIQQQPGGVFPGQHQMMGAAMPSQMHTSGVQISSANPFAQVSLSSILSLIRIW